jgi:hypothetical protein
MHYEMWFFNLLLEDKETMVLEVVNDKLTNLNSG